MTNHITTGMTNYRNGPQYAFNYNGLVTCFGQGCPFWDVLRHIRAHRLTTMDCNEGVYCHNDIATAGLGVRVRVRALICRKTSQNWLPCPKQACCSRIQLRCGSVAVSVGTIYRIVSNIAILASYRVVSL